MIAWNKKMLKISRCNLLAFHLVFCIHAVWASGSALDVARFIPGPPAQIGVSVGTDSNGYIYIVGATESPATFPVTAGALSISSRGSAVFLQELTPDGSQLLFSALLAGLGDASASSVQAQVDAAGNVYVAFTIGGAVAGSPPWLGDPNGTIGVLKVAPSGDKILWASKVSPFALNLALALDSDGSVFVGSSDYTSVHLYKLDGNGNQTGYSYTITDTHEPGHDTYDGSSLKLAALSDHSLYVMASPSFLYRLDAEGKSELTRVNVGDGNVQLSALAADGNGNAYVGGFTTAAYTVPSTQVDSAVTMSGMNPGLIAKFDLSGSQVYSDLFDLRVIEALTVLPSGLLWAGGITSAGFTIFQLDQAGTGLLHYVSLAAPVRSIQRTENELNSIAVDPQGRPLAVGTTTATAFPGINHWTDLSYTSDDPNRNAFLARLSLNAAQTDLQVSVAAVPNSAATYGTIIYTATITNAGTQSASDVILKLSDLINGVDQSNFVEFCVSSGQGICDQFGSDWRVLFPSIAPGGTETVTFFYSVPSPDPSPLIILFTALTSTDDPSQLNNRAAAPVTIQPGNFAVSLEGAVPAILVDIAGYGGALTGCIAGFGCLGNLPVNLDSPTIYVPTPLYSYGLLYAFAGWGDGSTDNPRTFAAGVHSATIILRQVTEPWIDPDTGFVQSASYRTGPVSPGEIITLSGANLGPATLTTAQLDAQGRIATELAGFQAFFDGVAAPIVYASANQSAVIVPYSVAGKQTVHLTLENQQGVSTPVTIGIIAAAPGLYTAKASGAGPLAAYNADNSLNTRDNPVARGVVVVLYATGEGLSTPIPADGEIAGANPPAPNLPVSVTIGAQQAEVLYRGGVPGSTAGLMQVNVRVPASVSTGLLPVILSVGQYSSGPGVTIAVQ
jgi:uncharacterized protein (TIGR03437 family)